MSAPPPANPRAPVVGPPGERARWWSFRMWHGMPAGVWFPLLARHRFRVSPSRLGRVLVMSVIACLSAVPTFMQRRVHGAAIRAEPVPPPVFIIGHWRSGTTLLHELMATDRRFVTPRSLECFAAGHFLRSGGVLRRLAFLLPSRRPMDDMAMGWDRPQEDEFALLAMGQPSPYEVMAFPNGRGAAIRHLHVGDLPAARRAAWEAALVTIMKRVALARRRARPEDGVAPEWFLLKSPTHTARIGVLARLFPDARFIHVVRDPVELFASSERLWRATFETQGLQRPRYDTGPGAPPPLQEFTFGTLRALYRDFDRDVAALPPGRFAEVRYEDLVRAPEAELARLRSEVGLPPGDGEALRLHLAGLAGYRRNRHVVDAATAASIRDEWRWYAGRFNYPVEPASVRRDG